MHDPALTTVAEQKAIQGTASVTERYAHRRPDMFGAADYARIGVNLRPGSAEPASITCR